MVTLVHDFVSASAANDPEAIALRHRGTGLSYAELDSEIQGFARALLDLGLEPNDRVAVYLPKRFETVVALFGAAAAGGVFVPVNPLLKPEQVQHILTDCNVRILVSSADRLALLVDALYASPDLRQLICVDPAPIDPPTPPLPQPLLHWTDLLGANVRALLPRRIDADMAAILYTSGSTGRPKGVVLSHRNLVAGAQSVAEYLGNTADDRILAVLPLSFDYGLSQLTTAFCRGACAVLMDYLLAREVLRVAAQEGITGLAAVPPLWIQLARLEWPDEVRQRLRYITNSGGHMPPTLVDRLRELLPGTRVYLMYGLTEAFRSTYLPPEQIDERPGSMGKAIPNAEILVVDADGRECAPNEPGELVHRGALVSLGYWNDPERTAVRFRPAPGRPGGVPNPELAVWSGDKVRRDEDGYLYFLGRDDEMIKTSGYRVSPAEVEDIIQRSGLVDEVVVVGVAHPELGQAIVALLVADATVETELMATCRTKLPGFMVPAQLVFRADMPRNANGKLDRPALKAQYEDLFESQTTKE